MGKSKDKKQSKTNKNERETIPFDEAIKRLLDTPPKKKTKRKTN